VRLVLPAPHFTLTHTRTHQHTHTLTHNWQGEQERAEAMLREAVKLDPAWKEAAHNLVYVRTQGRGPG